MKFDVHGLVKGLERRYHRIPAASRDEAWAKFQAAYSKYECVFIKAPRVG